MFRHFEQYDTDLNTYMKKQRESLLQYDNPELSDLSERSDENSADEIQRMNSINMFDYGQDEETAENENENGVEEELDPMAANLAKILGQDRRGTKQPTVRQANGVRK